MKNKVFIIILMILIVSIYMSIKNRGNEEIVEESLSVANLEITTPKVALTFDDGPNIYTNELLDGLKERGVKATFFVIGQNIENNEETLKRIYKEGHLIGNHTYNHVDLAKTEYKEAQKQIEDTNQYINSLTGYMPEFIRPPYGDWDENLAKETKMSVVLWNVDPKDWKDQNVNIVTARILKNTRPGDIILLHDIFKTSVEAALKVVDALQEKGYEFVTVEELRKDEANLQKYK